MGGIMAWQKGFSLLELLIVVAILALLLLVGIQNLIHSRQVARDRAALAHAHSVFKASWAYLAEDSARTLVAGDCTQGYTAGTYSVPNPGTSVQSCTVRDRGDGTPEVEVVAQSGRTFRLP